jgi:hypothetical protein
MSDSNEVLSEQDQELRRRNVISGTGDYQINESSKKSSVGSVNPSDDSDRDNQNDRDTIDSDQVSYCN